MSPCLVYIQNIGSETNKIHLELKNEPIYDIKSYQIDFMANLKEYLVKSLIVRSHSPLLKIHIGANTAPIVNYVSRNDNSKNSQLNKSYLTHTYIIGIQLTTLNIIICDIEFYLKGA